MAHLAGSLGVPCWVLLSKVPCWRWMEEGELSDWYKTSRLFRSVERYDQDTPVSEMKDRLVGIIERKEGFALP